MCEERSEHSWLGSWGTQRGIGYTLNTQQALCIGPSKREHTKKQEFFFFEDVKFFWIITSYLAKFWHMTGLQPGSLMITHLHWSFHSAHKCLLPGMPVLSPLPPGNTLFFFQCSSQKPPLVWVLGPSSRQSSSSLAGLLWFQCAHCQHRIHQTIPVSYICACLYQ